MNRIKNLDLRFENVLEDYYRDQYGTKSVPARWKKCVDFANGNLGTAVSALYVRKYFDLESKHKVGGDHDSDDELPLYKLFLCMTGSADDREHPR